MFYLVEFFKSLGESLIRGFSFFFLSCLIAFGLTHRSWINNFVQQISPEKIVNPYFIAVLDDTVDVQNFRKALLGLPGVLQVQDKNQEDSRRRLNQLVKQLGQNYKVDSDLMNFKSLRIAMNPALSRESMDFVREQAVKFSKKEHLTTSEIKYPEVANVMNSHPFYSFVAKAGGWGVLGIFALCWIISFWLCYDVFRSRSYLIEKFQRKKLVASKTIACGLSLITLAFSGLGLLNGTLKFFDLVILLMLFSVFWSFSMKHWRWKPTL
jgi:hypothetical protein